VILLGGVNWIGSHQLDPRAPIAANAKPLEVMGFPVVTVIRSSFEADLPPQRRIAVQRLG